VAETLETVGMMELLKVYPTVVEAIASFRFFISNKRMERRTKVTYPPFKFSSGLSTANLISLIESTQKSYAGFMKNIFIGCITYSSEIDVEIVILRTI